MAQAEGKFPTNLAHVFSRSDDQEFPNSQPHGENFDNRQGRLRSELSAGFPLPRIDREFFKLRKRHPVTGPEGFSPGFSRV